MTRFAGLAAAALIGGLTSILANGAKDLFTAYTPEPDEWVAYACFAAFPFLVLTLARLLRPLPWLVGIALTLLAWGAYLAIGIPQLRRDGFIDMGLGFLVATSPLWIAIVSVAVGMFTRGRPPSAQGVDQA